MAIYQHFCSSAEKKNLGKDWLSYWLTYLFIYLESDRVQIEFNLFPESNAVGRLNGVDFLVTVFEQVSHVLSPFWSLDKINWEVHLFHE